MIYFIQAGDDGPIKIGWAENAEDRLSHLQTGSPEPLRLLAVAPGGQKGERRLHAAFHGSRLRGEWFEPTPSLLALVAEVAEPDPDPVLATLPWWPEDGSERRRPMKAAA